MAKGNDLLRNVYLKAIFPNMIAILGGTINVFVDGVLIGQRMGETGIAAVNQSLAVYLILCTIGSLFAAGASAESAHAMGERDVEKGKEHPRLKSPRRRKGSLMNIVGKGRKKEDK